MDMQRATILMKYLKTRVKEPRTIRQVGPFAFQHKNLKNQVNTYYVMTAQEYTTNKLTISDEASVVSFGDAYIISLNNKTKRKFKLAVTYEVCGYVEVEAETLEEAMHIFEEDKDNISLPKDAEYVDDSFTLSTYDVDEMRALTED